MHYRFIGDLRRGLFFRRMGQPVAFRYRTFWTLWYHGFHHSQPETRSIDSSLTSDSTSQCRSESSPPCAPSSSTAPSSPVCAAGVPFYSSNLSIPCTHTELRQCEFVYATFRRIVRSSRPVLTLSPICAARALRNFVGMIVVQIVGSAAGSIMYDPSDSSCSISIRLKTWSWSSTDEDAEPWWMLGREL